MSEASLLLWGLSKGLRAVLFSPSCHIFTLGVSIFWLSLVFFFPPGVGITMIKIGR